MDIVVLFFPSSLTVIARYLLVTASSLDLQALRYENLRCVYGALTLVPFAGYFVPSSNRCLCSNHVAALFQEFPWQSLGTTIPVLS